MPPCVRRDCQCGRTHRSEEHTSELQSHSDLVCRLLLEKKNNRNRKDTEDNTKKTYALHLGGPSNPAGIMIQKLAKWYGSKANIFPVFFFIGPAPPEIYTLSLHDALPI